MESQLDAPAHMLAQV
jgi:hypothetical protein